MAQVRLFGYHGMVRLSIDALEDQLFLGYHEGQCPYLPDRDQRLLFLRGDTVGQLYRILLDEGYRRSGEHLYRPACEGCYECKVLRVPVADFKPSKSQRRIYKKGKDLFHIEAGRPKADEQRIVMYNRYLAFQHRNPDGPESLESYRRFFADTFLGNNRTRELRLMAGNRLAGIGIVDVVADVLSSVYFYFDPEFAEYSPGTWSMLAEIEYARSENLDYYYPGYYIEGCQAMSYKIRLRPNEIRSLDREGFEPGE